jgi:hypothetical protein
MAPWLTDRPMPVTPRRPGRGRCLSAAFGRAAAASARRCQRPRPAARRGGTRQRPAPARSHPRAGAHPRRRAREAEGLQAYLELVRPEHRHGSERRPGRRRSQQPREQCRRRPAGALGRDVPVLEPLGGAEQGVGKAGEVAHGHDVGTAFYTEVPVAHEPVGQVEAVPASRRWESTRPPRSARRTGGSHQCRSRVR